MIDLPKLPDIEDFINFKKKVGPLQLLEIGYPGTGKSSHATQVIIKCLERPRECVIMHGDLTCEWKHFLNYSKYIKKVIVLLPENAKLIFKNIDKLQSNKYKVDLEFITVDYTKFNVVDYLEEKCITVIYDDCFRPIDKTLLWVRLAQQLVSRDKKLNYVITYLCHETGNYYPQSAKGKQWEAVDEFISYFNFFRKMNIRAILLSQLETEVYDRLRKKCIWKAYRICYPSDRSHARLIKKYVKKMSIENYNLFYGDLFSPLNKNKPTNEIRIRTMIIPRVLIELNGDSHLGRGANAKKATFEREIGSYGRIRLGQNIQKLGVSEGDRVRITIEPISS